MPRKQTGCAPWLQMNARLIECREALSFLPVLRPQELGTPACRHLYWRWEKWEEEGKRQSQSTNAGSEGNASDSHSKDASGTYEEPGSFIVPNSFNSDINPITQAFLVVEPKLGNMRWFHPSQSKAVRGAEISTQVLRLWRMSQPSPLSLFVCWSPHSWRPFKGWGADCTPPPHHLFLFQTLYQQCFKVIMSLKGWSGGEFS